MVAININEFMGERPIVEPNKLPLGFAVEAVNCNFASKSLEPIKGLGPPVHTFSNSYSGTITRYPYNNAWLNFSGDVDIVRSPIANDSWERVYWTDGIYPKYSNSTNAGSSSFRLGIPKPSSPPTLTVSGSSEDGAIPVDCAYIVTYVSSMGEEGPPSDPSEIITRLDGNVIELTNLPDMPSGAFDIALVRIYRTEGYGTYNYVGQINAGIPSFSDNLRSEQLGAPCPSFEWLSPPSNLVGLTVIGNGILAGFHGNTLCFCEAYQPHAWPLSYCLAFPSEIVGIAMTASGIVVTTKQEPWVVAGSHPSAMSQHRLDSPFACVSKHTMVDMGEYVLYASNDGLVAAAGGNIKLVSSSFISSADFKALAPENWKSYRVDDRYFVITPTNCLSFSPSEGFRKISISAEAAYYDKQESELYVLDSARRVRKWGGGLNLQYVWASGAITLPPRVNFVFCRVNADGLCQLEILADGRSIINQSIDGSDIFRLPAARYREIQIKITSSVTVHSVSLAQSSREII